MVASESQKKATKKWQKANREHLAEYHKEYESQFANLKLRLTKEQKAVVVDKAKSEGKSINQYIIDKIL